MRRAGGAPQRTASYGAWISFGDTQTAEIVSRSGFDWLILDAQHGNVNEANLLPLLQAVELGGTPALVRVKANDPAQIMRALDFGAAGIIVPMVSTKAEAVSAVQATRYPPAGIRSFGPIRRSGLEGDGSEPLCIAMIETVEAIQNLDAIATVAGLGGLFVGAIDLACSMGLGAATDPPPQVLDAIAAVASACERHHLICAAAAATLEAARALHDRGAKFITIASDAGILRRGAASQLALARGGLN
jgi:4-hydroxy-2-oxoheptanedioate aldolase